MTDVLMNTYHRLPVTFTRGEGAWLFDDAGRRFLDWTSGIAVNCLGHAYPPLVKAISEQAAKYNHVCNYFHSDISEVFAEKLVSACAGAGMKKVFLGNSGGEANEGAIKIARKYSFDKYGLGRHTIVTLRNSFHGRTITTLSATGQDAFHEKFAPFTEGFVYIEPGADAESLAALDRALDRGTVAGLFMEAVQGESGIRPLPPEFVACAAKLCAERDILLMFDEVQCGMGRTGTFLACEQYHDAEGKTLRPDVVTLAKALAGGIPAGAVLAGEKTCDVLGPGDHGSTFGGNPIAAAAGLVVLNTLPGLMQENVRKGGKIMQGVRDFASPHVKEVRGRGLMIGVDIDEDAWSLLEKGVARAKSAGEPGLLMLSAGAKTLRFLPPYVIGDDEIEQGLEILKSLL
jgi:acetylornithine/N-succinyldiaminopimelate aminotransferase